MSLLGHRQKPKKEATVRDRLGSFVRVTRVPEGMTLDAISGGLTPQVCLDAGRCYPPEKVLEDAFAVYAKAIETVRRGMVGGRGPVRGCTSELLVLVVQQALDLAVRLDEHGKWKNAQAASLAAVQQKLRTNFANALSLREQARRLLAAMGRDDAAYLDEVLRAATAADEGGAAAAAMFALAAIGRRLLADLDPRVSQRASLLGLDETYLATLEGLGHDLRSGQDELRALAEEANMPDDSIYAEAGLTVHLMMNVIEAFAAAHEVDHAVPILRPVHTQRMVRRISRLPPPPPPSVSIRPVARVADVTRAGAAGDAKVRFLRRVTERGRRG